MEDRSVSVAGLPDQRVHDLLDALAAIGGDLEPSATLRRVVQAAVTLVDARYGALGVVGAEGGLVDFVQVGFTPEQVAAVGRWPCGEGLLGLLIRDPRPVRLEEIGDHPASVGFPAGHPPMRSFLGAPVRVGDEVFGNIYLADKRGGSFTAEDEVAVAVFGRAAGTAIGHARLYARARREDEWNGARADLTQRLLAGAGLADALARVESRLRALMVADAVAVVGPDELAGEGLCRSAGEEVPDSARAALGVADRVLALPLGDHGTLLVGRGVERPPFDDEVCYEAKEFAYHLTVALDAAARRRDSERLRLLEERNRIARDLHDTVIQRIFATGMSLQSAGRLVEDRPKAARRVEDAVDALNDTIKQIRATIFALKSDDGHPGAGLRAETVGLVRSAAAYFGFTPELRFSGALDSMVPARVRAHALAVLREALTNAVRHSRARHVEVSVELREDWLEVRVRDDGVGLPERPVASSGLRNMAGRAAELGGAFEASARDGGTTVVWRVPRSGWEA